MTSLIKADNIAKADGTSEVATEYVTQGSAKAAANIDRQATPAIDYSFNLSSISDIATGQVGITLASSLSDANWSGSLSVVDSSAGRNSYAVNGGAPTASYVQANVTNASNSFAGIADLGFQAFGDLA